jgi:hypothetical protein
VLEYDILQLLSKSFHALTSLSLEWKDDAVPESALRIIGTIKSLKQISLGAGHRYSVRRNWLIDHELMRKHLAKLPNLKKLALCGDSYDRPIYPKSIQRYYIDRSISPNFLQINELEAPADVEARKAMWEHFHRMYMEAHAQEYVDVLPKLEWIFLGQLPMQVVTLIEGNGRNKAGERVVIGLTKTRDDCWSFLRRTFDGDGEGAPWPTY